MPHRSSARTLDLRAAAAAIRAERPDLVAHFPDPDAPGFLRWAAVDGTLEYPDRLGRFFPPLPPEELRAAGSGGPSARHHLASGFDDHMMLTELVDTWWHRPATELRDVFDFGCGCGRVLRWFEWHHPDARCRGADLRADSIAWCAEHLSGPFAVNGPRPPLDLPDDSVDLVYAISVFTHLDREDADAWMRELARICRPDGLLLVSTIAEFTLFVTQRSPDHQRLLDLDRDQARALARRLAHEHFVHLPLEQGHGPGRGCGRPLAFLDEEFVRTAWVSHVEPRTRVPAIQELWQDVWVLAPRK